jgi:hypothetical protein
VDVSGDHDTEGFPLSPGGKGCHISKRMGAVENMMDLQEGSCDMT